MKLNQDNKSQIVRIFLLLTLVACLSAFTPTPRLVAQTIAVKKAVRLSIQERANQPLGGEHVVTTVFAENTSRFPVALTRFSLEATSGNGTEMRVIFPTHSSKRDLFSRVVGEIDEKRAVVKRTYYVDAIKFGSVEFADGSVAAPGRGPRPPQWRYDGKDKLVQFQVLMPGEKIALIDRVTNSGRRFVLNSEVSYFVLDETMAILQRSAMVCHCRNVAGERIIADPDGFVAMSSEQMIYEWTKVANLEKPKKPFVEGRQPVKNSPVELLPWTADNPIYPFALPRAEFEQLRAGKFSVTSTASRFVKVVVAP